MFDLRSNFIVKVDGKEGVLFPGRVRQQPFKVLPPVLTILRGELLILVDEHVRILERVEGEDRRDIGVASCK